jgi:hypothetical protein
LIVVVAAALLLSASVVAGVSYKTRAPRLRCGKGNTTGDQTDEDALRLQRQEARADKSAARAHAAQIEVDIKTIRADSLQEQATVDRSEAVTFRDHLNELKGNADKLTAAGQPPTMPRLAG